MEMTRREIIEKMHEVQYTISENAKNILRYEHGIMEDQATIAQLSKANADYEIDLLHLTEQLVLNYKK